MEIPIRKTFFILFLAEIFTIIALKLHSETELNLASLFPLSLSLEKFGKVYGFIFSFNLLFLCFFTFFRSKTRLWIEASARTDRISQRSY